MHTFLISFPSGGEWLIVVLIVVGILFVPYILFLITLQNTLKSISPANRQLDPYRVWLLLMPLVGSVYKFIVNEKLSDSIRNEARSRGIMLSDARPTYGIGLAHAILNACTLLPVLRNFLGIAWIVTWIIYWVKVSEWKSRFSVPVQTDDQSTIFY